MIISPTVGRVVWVFRPAHNRKPQQPEVGLVAYVHDDHLINVAGFDHYGDPFKLTSLPLVQPDEPKPEGNFAAWMPYQQGQAAKHAEPPAPAPAPDVPPSKTEAPAKGPHKK
jgi:hypothetical protein